MKNEAITKIYDYTVTTDDLNGVERWLTLNNMFDKFEGSFNVHLNTVVLDVLVTGMVFQVICEIIENNSNYIIIFNHTDSEIYLIEYDNSGKLSMTECEVYFSDPIDHIVSFKLFDKKISIKF